MKSKKKTEVCKPSKGPFAPCSNPRYNLKTRNKQLEACIESDLKIMFHQKVEIAGMAAIQRAMQIQIGWINKRLKFIIAKNAKLKEEVQDWRDTQRRVMSEVCPSDEKHCTCVPSLRKDIKKLKEKLAGSERTVESMERRHKEIMVLKKKRG